MYWLLVAWVAITQVDSGQIPLFQSVTDDIFCGKVPSSCVESKYRSYDGSCNNLQKSWFGTPYTPYRRLLSNTNANNVQPLYDDSLPNPRNISLNLFVDLEVEDGLWTVLFMQYGQLIAHDLSLTSGVAQTKKDAIICCSSDGQLTEEARTNPRCAPIEIPSNDPYNAIEGKICMDFFRVQTTKDHKNCSNAPKVPEPLSSVTAWLDLSFLYGGNEERANKLREFNNGYLAHVNRKGKMLLTQDPLPQLACNVESSHEPCYFTGDERVNQNPELALLHNVYMQYHNYVANQLSAVNPHWNDETLFQETRRILIAMHQNIIYYEFLPEFLGLEFMTENKIFYPYVNGFIEDYNPEINPGVSNEFSAATFRTFHTEIVGMIWALQENRSIGNIIKLSDHFDNPSVCEHANNFNGFTRGLATQPQSAVDRFMTNDILNLLFKDGLLGLDLAAIDIQRGRDQAVATYAEALRAFNLMDPTGFESYEKFMSPQKVVALTKLYKSHEDVDLVVALHLENRIPYTLVSPLAQRILGEQFYRTRVADSCFYENKNGKCAFTLEQLLEIQRSGTISGILCNNNEIEQMQPQAFKLISEKNPLKSCKDIPIFNAEAWKEYPIEE